MILIVEDDPAIANTLKFALNHASFQTEWVSLGEKALSRLQTDEKTVIEMIILDVGLPDINGFEVCRQLRQFSSVPVLFLTAHNQEVDRIQGFELGADDYLCKPFSPRELVSRVRAVLRRVSPPQSVQDSAPLAKPLDYLHSGPLRLWSEQVRVEVNGQPIQLTRTEFKLLELLMRYPRRVFSREQLLDMTQGVGSPTGDRAVDTHIKTLRAKLSRVAPDFDPIRTQRGFGYSMEPDAN